MRKFLLCLLLTGGAVFGQNGDKPGEIQVAPIADSEIPPAPILSPAESLKTFKLQPGFKIELVAAEPLVQAPVAMAFHPDGSLYVVEMRGFMPNVDGKGEDQHIGRVTVLRDTDGDGKMDRSTVFLDGLQLPRAIALVDDGVLIAEPPNLWFCRDTNKDGVCDEKTLLASDYGSQQNPEHTANGLLWGLDNWIYSANYTNRFRRIAGKWVHEPSAMISGRGQWGISQDDVGRLVFNSNSDYLRGDLVPPELLFRNPNLASPFGANVQFDRNQATFPIRPNPGVNRGYQKGQLRQDGTLATFTAACGPVIYRGDQFDPMFYGCAFVCEPAGNFVRCARLSETNGIVMATNAFPGAEFLASTEERFRPVNLYNGRDGALYVVDLHRGVLQHRVYVTTYLRKQYTSRGLETPLDFGRIYRVVQEGRPRRKFEPMKTGTPDLVSNLRATNGWTRDTAQRLLVEAGDSGAVESLVTLARSDKSVAAVHAVWTLHGMEKLDSATLVAVLGSTNPRARAAAARIAGERISEPAVREAVIHAASDDDPLVQLSAAFSLCPTANSANTQEALARILESHADEQLFRDAVISGLRDQEILFLEFLLKRPAWQNEEAGLDAFVTRLARAGAASRNTAVNKILDLAAAESSWRRVALVDGLLPVGPARAKGKAPNSKPKVTRLDIEPAALTELKKDAALTAKIKSLEESLTWPGKAGAAETAVRPLSGAEKEQFESGKQTYLLTCAACHQPHGLGQEGLAPPLVDSDWVTGSEKRLARIVLQGIRGPLNVNGKQYSLEMPPLGILEDQQIAAILTYVRREWNHTASPVTTEFITKTRGETASREEPWSEADLLKIQ